MNTRRPTHALFLLVACFLCLTACKEPEAAKTPTTATTATSFSSAPIQLVSPAAVPSTAAAPSAVQTASIINEPSLRPDWSFGKLRAGEQAPPLDSQLDRRNTMIVFDASRSMLEVVPGLTNGRTKFDVAKDAFIDSLTYFSKDENVGVLLFDENGTRVVVELQPLNPTAIRKVFDSIAFGSYTPLRTATKKAYESLEKQAKRQNRYGYYTILLFTDGDPTPTVSEDPSPAVQYVLENSPVEIKTIGFGLSKRHVLNQPGKTIYFSAMNPEELQVAFKEAIVDAEDPEFQPTYSYKSSTR